MQPLAPLGGGPADEPVAGGQLEGGPAPEQCGGRSIAQPSEVLEVFADDAPVPERMVAGDQVVAQVVGLTALNELKAKGADFGQTTLEAAGVKRPRRLVGKPRVIARRQRRERGKKDLPTLRELDQKMLARLQTRGAVRSHPGPLPAELAGNRRQPGVPSATNNTANQSKIGFEDESLPRAENRARHA